MVDGLFYWLIDQLINFLARINPARAKKVAEIKAEADRLNGLAKENEKLRLASEAAYADSRKKRAEWDHLLELSRAEEAKAEAQFNESRERVKQIEADTKKLKDAIDRKPDADVLRDPL